MPWGVHAVLNVARACPKAIRCPLTIARFSDDLVRRIDMTAYGGPQIQHFGEGNKAGYTLVQLIETSNIVAHFVEETNDIYVDVFSCKTFETQEVVRCIRDHFRPEHIDFQTLQRQARHDALPSLR
jgi:S-adenosylmethionine/arginine decarboxylase-like enzyme